MRTSFICLNIIFIILVESRSAFSVYVSKIDEARQNAYALLEAYPSELGPSVRKIIIGLGLLKRSLKPFPELGGSASFSRAPPDRERLAHLRGPKPVPKPVPKPTSEDLLRTMFRGQILSSPLLNSQDTKENIQDNADEILFDGSEGLLDKASKDFDGKFQQAAFQCLDDRTLCSKRHQFLDCEIAMIICIGSSILK
jgi:hypothetical protein